MTSPKIIFLIVIYILIHVFVYSKQKCVARSLRGPNHARMEFLHSDNFLSPFRMRRRNNFGTYKTRKGCLYVWTKVLFPDYSGVLVVRCLLPSYPAINHTSRMTEGIPKRTGADTHRRQKILYLLATRCRNAPRLV